MLFLALLICSIHVINAVPTKLLSPVRNVKDQNTTLIQKIEKAVPTKFVSPVRNVNDQNMTLIQKIEKIEDVSKFMASSDYARSGDVRLVGGRNKFEGRLEIGFKGRWGTVCDDAFSLPDAQVVCGQLEEQGDIGDYFDVSSVYVFPHGTFPFGQGTGPIWLDDVGCSGREDKLEECSNRGIGTHNCQHHEDVAIRCNINHVIRLSGGQNPGEGRLEIFLNEQWGTVCDDSFTAIDAKVVCGQLGVQGDIPYVWGTGVQIDAVEVLGTYGRGFGPGTGNIWLDDVDCDGDELLLSGCGHAGIGTHNCAHYEDVSIRCFSERDVRLAGGPNRAEGRVEIFLNGSWGTVCDDSFTTPDAQVVCRQLTEDDSWGTCVTSTHVFPPGHNAGTGPIWLDNVACGGSELSLDLCPHAGIGTHNCAHSEDSNIRCDISGAVRLVGGSNLLEGRLEVYFNGRWGTVCDDHFSTVDAEVVCRQLARQGNLGNSGYSNYYSSTGAHVFDHGSVPFGAGTGTIFLDDVNCDGSELRLDLCPIYGSIGDHNCQHSEDVSIRCYV
jgi:deleted-in-malignant-brain-tumors protein 1